MTHAAWIDIVLCGCNARAIVDGQNVYALQKRRVVPLGEATTMFGRNQMHAKRF